MIDQVAARNQADQFAIFHHRQPAQRAEREQLRGPRERFVWPHRVQLAHDAALVFPPLCPNCGAPASRTITVRKVFRRTYHDSSPDFDIEGVVVPYCERCIAAHEEQARTLRLSWTQWLVVSLASGLTIAALGSAFMAILFLPDALRDLTHPRFPVLLVVVGCFALIAYGSLATAWSNNAHRRVPPQTSITRAFDFSARKAELFDLPFMAEKAVGRYWNEVTPEERNRLVDAFSRYTIANFAGRFDAYSGQHFETLGREPSARDTMMVRTRLIDPGRENVQLDYRLRANGSRWKIVDIYMNGAVSELALRRSEYASLIKREGFAALLAALDARVQELATAPADKES